MNQNNLVTKDEFKRGIKELKEEMVDMFDKLGVAVAKGFEETATKEELKAVENRLTNVENGLTDVENRLENVEEEVKDVKSQIVFRKDDVNNLKADTPSLSQFNNHEKRINKLENSVFAS